MTEFTWTDIVAIVTGVVGALTGMLGAILGYISYRRSNLIKALDLRIELKKALNLLVESIAALEGQIEDCDTSRKAVASASGNFHSGSMEKWKTAVVKDREVLKRISHEVPQNSDGFTSLSHAQLEEMLVHIHQLQTKIASLNSKYDREMAKDDEQRRFIRDQAHARFRNNT